LQKSKSAIFDGCNPLKYRDTILDKSVKNRFLQQNLSGVLTHHPIRTYQRQVPGLLPVGTPGRSHDRAGEPIDALPALRR
jgi:hypothetical protein